MFKIPANSKPNKVLLAWALALDVMLALLILFSPSRGSCSGIEGQILHQQKNSVITRSSDDANREKYVIIVHDESTGRVITRITPDEDGFFRMKMIPGRYRLEVMSLQETVQLEASASAEVTDGKFTNVTIQMNRRMTEQALPASPKDFLLRAENSALF